MTDTPMTEQDADRIEELVRYIAAHDGRLPTDDMPLAWWLVEALDHPKSHPVRKVLAGIPIAKHGVTVSLGRARAWSDWLAKFDRIVWAGRRGQTIDDAVSKDKQLKDWVNLQLSRRQVGDLRPVESFMLPRAPLWDFSREPDTNKSRKRVAFKAGLLAIKSFRRENGHADVPPGTMVDDLDLHAWWKFQRSAYANGQMKEFERSQIAKLKKAGIDLRPDKVRAAEDIAFRYRDRLEELADCIGKHGMSALPERGGKFATNAHAWIAQYHKGTLEPELIDALEAIEGWSWERDADLAAVGDYAQAHGHVDVPRDYVTADGYPLGAELYRLQKQRWMAAHPSRATQRRGKLLDRLAQQGWSRGVRELADWADSRGGMPGETAVTGSGFLLGRFMKYAAEAARQGLLTSAQLKGMGEATGDPRWVSDGLRTLGGGTERLTRFARGNAHCHPAWGQKVEGWDLSRFTLRVCADREAEDLAVSVGMKLESLPGWSWSRRERVRLRDAARPVRTRRDGGSRGVRTDVPDPDTKLSRPGLRQFLPSS